MTGSELIRTQRLNRRAALLAFGVLLAASVRVCAQSLPPVPENPSLTYHAPTATGIPNSLQGTLTGTPNDPVVLTYGGELNISARDIYLDEQDQTYRAIGNPTVREFTAELSAGTLQLQGGRAGVPAVGTATDALLVRPPFTIRAPLITFDSKNIVGDDAYFTTAPPTVRPAYFIRARKLVLFPRMGTGEIDDGALYVLGKRIVTIRRYRFQYGASGSPAGRNQFPLPAFGVSSRYGLFGSLNAPAGTLLPVSFYVLLPTRNSVQARVIAAQVIHVKRKPKSAPEEPIVVVGEPGKPSGGPPGGDVYTGIDNLSPATAVNQSDRPSSAPDKLLSTIRSYAVGGGILPLGDPLTFYQLIPWPVMVKPLDPHPGFTVGTVEQVSEHIETSGNQINYLFVSRLPELGVSMQAPITRVYARPEGGDPVKFRRYLRKPVLYVGASTTVGSYFEQPTNIRSNRWQDNAWLTTSPVLVARNTVVVPRLLGTYNWYDNSQNSYRFAQASLSAMHYLSDRTGFGFDYFLSSVSGSSPFNFDVLDAAQELDARVQVGNRNIAVGGVARIDLDGGGVFDYKVTVAPTIRGLIPVITYDFQNRGVDFGLDFRGLTF